MPPRCPAAMRAGTGPHQLAASITYSFTHLTGNTRRLLPAVCLFHGVVAAAVLGVFSRIPGAAAPSS